MYKKILVSLDGSEFSESALLHASTISSSCHVPELIWQAAVAEESSIICHGWCSHIIEIPK